MSKKQKLKVTYIEVPGQTGLVKFTQGEYVEPTKREDKTFTLFKYSAYNQGRQKHMMRNTSTLSTKKHEV